MYCGYLCGIQYVLAVKTNLPPETIEIKNIKQLNSKTLKKQVTSRPVSKQEMKEEKNNSSSFLSY